MATRRNVEKTAVLKKLSSSMNYCNSHHLPVQPLYEQVVDECVASCNGLPDPARRAAEMKALFPILQIEDLAGFIPSIPTKQNELDLSEEEFLRYWFSKWIGKYTGAWRTLPSERMANPKGAVTDNALIRMVAARAGNIDEAVEWAAHHNLYMSAENVGGNLLEEYIAGKVAPYGWIWCRGEILTAIDFCNSDCTAMFQVKNKSNTENSSGKGFREAHGAVSWYRMRAERRNGMIETYWPSLVERIREGATTGDVPDDLMSEEDYLGFVESVSRNNPDLITDEEC